MMGGKRRGSVVPPTSTANDGGGGGVARGKFGEAESALPPLLESLTEKMEELQKTPAKAVANGDDAGEGDDGEDAGEEENAEEEGEKENEDSDMDVADGEEEAAEKTKLAEGFYLIEAVRKKRIRKGETQYFIKWRDWPESANTWEPLENLRMSVPDVIATFEESLLSRSRRKRKRRNSSSSLSQTRKKQQKRTPSNVSAEKLKIIEETLNPGVTNDTVITENDVDLVPSRIEGIEIEDNDEVIKTSKNPVEHVEQNAELTGQNAVANGSDKTESVDGLEDAPCTGARKRKSGRVSRFKPKSNSGGVDDLEKAAANSVRSENLELTRDDVGFNMRRNICTITEIIKVTHFTSCMTGNTANVCVTFLVKRSDGKEMTVDNKFLKSHFPDLLLDFYEQRLWCKV